MGLLSGDDFTQMAADMDGVRSDNEVSVVFRRQGGALEAQSVRVVRMGGRGSEKGGDGTQQVEGAVVVLGATTLDVQPQDRFTVGGVLYEVVVVRPNRRAATLAEARMVE